LNYSIMFMLSVVIAIPMGFVYLIKRCYREAAERDAEG